MHFKNKGQNNQLAFIRGLHGIQGPCLHGEDSHLFPVIHAEIACEWSIITTDILRLTLHNRHLFRNIVLSEDAYFMEKQMMYIDTF